MSRWWALVVGVIFIAGVVLGFTASQAMLGRSPQLPYPSNYQLPDTTAIP